MQATSASAASEQALPCDFRTVAGIDKARLAPLVTATEGFAQHFGPAFESRLGLACEATLQSSEQLTARASVEKGGNSFLMSLQLGKQAETAFLQIDSALLFPVLDRLLGGSGGPSELSRELTEIEGHVAKDFVQLICQELEAAWRTFDISVSIGTRQSPPQVQSGFSATDAAMVFSFSVNLPSAGGTMLLMLPVAGMGAFLSAPAPSIGEVARKGAMSPKLVENALDWTFDVELILSDAKILANDLLNLSIGKVFQLGIPVRTPTALKIGGYKTFEAVPVRRGHHRAAQLLERTRQGQIETGNQNDSDSD